MHNFIVSVSVLFAAALSEAKVARNYSPMSHIGQHIMELLAKDIDSGESVSKPKVSNLRPVTTEFKKQSDSPAFLTITAYTNSLCTKPTEQITLQMGVCTMATSGGSFYFASEVVQGTGDIIVGAVGFSDAACTPADSTYTLWFQNAYPPTCGEDVYYHYGLELDQANYYVASLTDSLPNVPNYPGIKRLMYTSQSDCTSSNTETMFYQEWVRKARCFKTADNTYEKLTCSDHFHHGRVRGYNYGDDSTCSRKNSKDYEHYDLQKCDMWQVTPPTTKDLPIAYCAYVSFECAIE